MKKTNVYLLRDNLASYLDEVVKNDSPLVVYKFNKPIVIIMPARKELINDDIDQYFGFMGHGETGDQFVKRVRRNPKERKYVENLRKGIT